MQAPPTSRAMGICSVRERPAFAIFGTCGKPELPPADAEV